MVQRGGQNGIGAYVVTTAPLEQAADRLAQYLAAAGIAAFLLHLGRYLRAGRMLALERRREQAHGHRNTGR